MKIGLSTSVIQGGRTGIAEYVFALIRAFAAVAPDHEFVLFVLEKDCPLFAFAAANATLVPVPERFRPPLQDILWHQLTLPKLVRIHRLDVLHVPSYRRMLWPKPCPLVATVHDLAPFRIPGKYDRKRMFYGRVVARRLARRQDAIIAISQTTAEDMARFWKLSATRVAVIHQGVDRERFAPAPAGIAKAVGRDRFGLDRPFFLYVARLEHPAKNHLRLIAAFEKFKTTTHLPWQLVLAGQDWHGADVIHSAIQRSPCSADIRRLGFVAEEHLPMLYRAADAFVYPSLYEGFGLPPVEAMACGCPVICSTRGALGEVVGDAALLVNPEDSDELASALARVSTQEEVRRTLRQSGLERAAHFDWQRTAAQTLEVYERAARLPRKANAPLTLAEQLSPR
jgi:glycosyltransferase involved in cell wall biosynthesis